MGAKRGRKPRAPTVDVRALTGLTHAELAALGKELKALRRADDFPPSVCVPVFTFDKLKQIVDGLQRQWTPTRIKRVRWWQVRDLLEHSDHCPGWPPSYEAACEVASALLEGTPAAAGPRMMRHAYQTSEKALPPEQRRSRKKDSQQSFLNPFFAPRRDQAG